MKRSLLILLFFCLLYMLTGKRSYGQSEFPESKKHEVGTVVCTSMKLPGFDFEIESGDRCSFTGNLFGYSSQYSSSESVYYFLNFTFTYKLNAVMTGLPEFRQ